MMKLSFLLKMHDGVEDETKTSNEKGLEIGVYPLQGGKIRVRLLEEDEMKKEK